MEDSWNGWETPPTSAAPTLGYPEGRRLPGGHRPRVAEDAQYDARRNPRRHSLAVVAGAGQLTPVPPSPQ
jgi:hypothetical protein